MSENKRMIDGEQPAKLVNFIGTLGWRQFLTAKKWLLSEYDQARIQAQSHEVETWHGKVGEGNFRKWLQEFLPKRYGVCPGYVISQGQLETCPMPHFDVIVYDALDAPVLWIESNADVSQAGAVRAIPAEHVRAVIEIKAAFTRASVQQSLSHLRELRPLLSGVDSPLTRYPKYLPAAFFSDTIFFELRKDVSHSVSILDSFLEDRVLDRGFCGGLVLRGDGLPEVQAGRVRVLSGMETILLRSYRRLVRICLEDFADRSQCL